MRAIADKVIVRQDKATESVSQSGVILPDFVKEGCQSGEVISVGCDVTELAVGDKVIFYTRNGTYIDTPDTYKTHVLPCKHVLAIVVEE